MPFPGPVAVGRWGWLLQAQGFLGVGGEMFRNQAAVTAAQL